VDGTSLAVLRIGFASLILLDVWRYLHYGWVQHLYLLPDFAFKYYGFSWVHVWPGNLLYWHFIFLGACALFMLLGWFYRFASLCCLLAFSYVFLLDQTYYLNHFYLVICVNVLLCIAPANQVWSLDKFFKRLGQHASIPYWAVLIFIIQFEIVYLFAGFVKLNADWLQGEPLTLWLQQRGDFPVLGPWFMVDWVPLVASYAVIALHLIGAPLLLCKRTRFAVLIIYTVFHCLNAWIFHIGIFPWLTIAGTLMFFEPDWPRAVFHKIKRLWQRTGNEQPLSLPTLNNVSAIKVNSLMIFFMAWFALQILIPLRHFAYPGNVSWTEEGHRFAWMMKLRDKQGRVAFYAEDTKTEEKWIVPLLEFLTFEQITNMLRRPDMILQFAHFLDTHYKILGYDHVAIYVDSRVELNGRPAQPLIDTERDLTQVERVLWPPADWIMPLKVALNAG